ncbi:hypothetical protein C8Q70DRAFT_304881 [Cubamyces menziesii]|nr:hypothetical protein C8Q70DRAFT_304881 [Cubamyces menziesii]
MTTAHSLYITLNFLRRENGVNKYHWGLFATDGTPPAGTLYHATDVGHQPLELFKEVRQIRNPQTSKTMVVVLRVTSTPGTQNLDYFSSASFVHLMDRRYLPQGEQYWTCRVWVKEVLKTLHNNRRIVLPANVDSIEQWCQYTADCNIQNMGYARAYNDLSWMSSSSTSTQSPTVPMEIDSTGRSTGSSRYTGSKMSIDSSW